MSSAFTIIITFIGSIGLGILDLPDHRQLADYRPAETTRVHAADGQLIREYFRENRAWVSLDSLPPYVVQAFISAEDQNFRDHIGIDLGGLARAAISNVRNVATGRRLEGGSTITQQVAKNLLLTNEVSILRKVREIILAILIEQTFTKDEILEIYLNEIYLGRGSYGIGTAAMRYFGVHPAELTLAQAAYLAALPKAPNNYHPIFRLDAAVARRNYVLDRMVEDGALTEAEAQAARDEPLVVRQSASPDTVTAPYFAEEVRRFVQREFDSEALYEGGLTVQTTLDPELQAIANEALREGLIAYDRRHGWRGPIDNMEVIVRQQQAIEAARAAEAEAADATDGDPAAVADDDDGSFLSTFDLFGRDAEDPAANEDETEALLPLWQLVLAEIDPPRGSGDWRLAVVIDVTSQAATVGLDDGEIGTIPLEEVTWARQTLRNQRLGAAVSRVTDVLALGDVILVEPLEPRLTVVPVNDEDGLPDPRRFSLRQVPNVQGGLIAISPDTGEIRAMVGGYSYALSEFNRATQALRQPGSAIKPFVYLAALQNGYTPSSVLLDVPIELEQGTDTGLWRPENYNLGFDGALPLRIGVERSRNVMTVRLLVELGIEPVAEVTNALGIYDDMPRLPSMGLGAGETTLQRLTTAYAMVANGGERITPYLIDRIQDRDGETIYRADDRWCPRCENLEWQEGLDPPNVNLVREQVIDPIAAYQMVSILRGVVQRGTAARLSPLGLPLAGKTGTTNDARDVWFVGFAPELAVGVYVGFDEPRTLGNESGSSAAVPIFGAFMERAMINRPDRRYQVPTGIQTAWVNRYSGHLAQAGAEGAILEVFREGALPGQAPAAVIFDETADRALEGTGGLY